MLDVGRLQDHDIGGFGPFSRLSGDENGGFQIGLALSSVLTVINVPSIS